MATPWSINFPKICRVPKRVFSQKASYSPSSTVSKLHLRNQHTSSSTSALAYKALHRRVSPFPTYESLPSWTAPAAVSSILYETPGPTATPPKRHILNCLVQNEPGVLSRVSGILAARGFNIDSLVVCNTELSDLSRMTIVLSGQDSVVEQARRQLEDLVPVYAVLDYTPTPLVQRELLLAKVSTLGPEAFEEWMAHHREMTDDDATKRTDDLADQDRTDRGEFHPSRLAASQALRHKYEHLDAITHLTHQFGGKVLDISTNSCIVEVYVYTCELHSISRCKEPTRLTMIYSSAKPTRIDSFMKLIKPFGILEAARTGLMAMPRSPLYTPGEATEKDVEDIVDVSALPPG